MAIVLQFKQGDSGTTLSLNSASAGFSLAGWAPAVATPVHMGDPAPIGESIHLRLKQANQNTLATSMQSLHEMQVLADRYINDPTQETPVWLHAKMANETGERRALVYGISVQYKSSWFGPEATAEDIPLVLNVVRGPYWEATTARNLPDAAPTAAASVVYNYTAAGNAVGAHDIVGDVGARIGFSTIYNTTNLHRYWMGTRSANKHGATGISNFVPIWECEDFGSMSADGTSTVDATASAGDKVVISESGLDWDEADFKKCISWYLNNVSTDEEDQFGNYLWLLRAKVGASTTWEVRLSFSFGGTMASSGEDIRTDIIEISDTDWGYYEMAIMPISLRNIHILAEAYFGKAYEGYYRVEIRARRTSGTSDLALDCICLIPTDEGFIKIESTENSTDEYVMFGQSPEGLIGAYSAVDVPGTLIQIPAVSGFTNFNLPPGDGRIYCVYSQKAGGADVLGNAIIFNDADQGRYYERWLSLRGSE